MIAKIPYSVLQTHSPIRTQYGTIVKPKLSEIADITFPQFYLYEMLFTITPEDFFIKVLMGDGEKIWNEFSDEQKHQITIFDLIENYPVVQDLYCQMLNFFLLENVTFATHIFIATSDQTDDVTGLRKVFEIDRGGFHNLMSLIAQTCCIDSEEEEIPKFKNKRAEELYYLFKKTKEEELAKKASNNTIENIISAVCGGRHPSLNYTNVYDLTVFQLIDVFKRLQINVASSMNEMRVSVWGDEKKQFDIDAWHQDLNKKSQ